MTRDPYVLTDRGRRWYYFGVKGGEVLRTTIPDRAKRYQNLTLAQQAADRIYDAHKAYFEPELMSRTAKSETITGMMDIPAIAEIRRKYHENQSQKHHDDQRLG